MHPEIKLYIEKRYPRWLDYSRYHCSHANILDQANDVLNEVLVALLEKDEKKVLRMYNTKKSGYRELDFFVLRMIKLNIYSPTSPYQNKYKPLNAIIDIDFCRLNIPDHEYEEDDKPALILAQFNQVRKIFEELNLSDKAKRIFSHRFFYGLPFSQWEGPEKPKELYETYNKVAKLIKGVINKKTLI